MNNDCPNNGNARPAESATICSNSVSGRGGSFDCWISEGLSGYVPGVVWRGFKPVGVFNCGTRSEVEE